MEKRRSGVVSCFTTDWVIDETFNTSTVARSSLSFLLFSFRNLEDVTLRMQCLYLALYFLLLKVRQPRDFRRRSPYYSYRE